MSHSTEGDDTGLRNSLQKLPQELYDRIYELTFTASPGVRDLGAVIYHSTPRNGPRQFSRTYAGNPFLGADSRNLLQVESASRALFAASYYGGEYAVFLARTIYAAQTWLLSVDAQQLKNISQLRVVATGAGNSTWYRFYEPHVAKKVVLADWDTTKKGIQDLGIEAPPELPENTKGGRLMRWRGGCELPRRWDVSLDDIDVVKRRMTREPQLV